jgi:poly(A) polymerase
MHDALAGAAGDSGLAAPLDAAGLVDAIAAAASDAAVEAHLVGGFVRDRLLGREGKDVDVVVLGPPGGGARLLTALAGRLGTAAPQLFPEFGTGQVRGRGWRVEAVEARRETYSDGSRRPAVVPASLAEDVWRRDFTANALYYNIADFSVWDYVDGVADIAARRLRLIGDPETRYREDPVRMLRAARFEAKLGFDIDPDTARPIATLRELLSAVPPARLFDETLKLFLSGHGARSFQVLRRRGLLAALVPSVDSYFVSHPGSLVEQLLLKGLENTDERVLDDKPVTPTFLFALLLYGPIAAIIEATPPERWHELATILEACDQAVREAQSHIAIPKRFALGVREMFALQPRLEHPRGRRALRVLEHPRFRAGYDLLLLRAEFGLAPPEMAAWWTRLQEAPAAERERMAEALTGEGARTPAASRRGGRRRRRGPRAKTAARS